MLEIERLGVCLEPENENQAKFNAGMVLDGDSVHMLYRMAFSEKNKNGNLDYHENQIHYAELLTDGKVIRDDTQTPAIAPDSEKDRAGCEDPRIVPFEGKYYVFYTAYDGMTPRVGVALTEDFQKYSKIGVIPTEQGDKDAFIFPERIHGKIVYMHRIEPDIQMDYFDTIEDMFDESYWKNYRNKLHERVVLQRAQPWENQKIGGSVPPIRTKDGWLLIYHGVANDRTPFCYRAGAALLDLENPSKVLARLPYPLLEPTEEYERVGDVNEVIFPQGAYRTGEWLYISYGAADKRVALARVKFDELLSELSQYSK